MKHSSGWQPRRAAAIALSRLTTRAIVCQLKQSTDPETIATFLDSELDGVDDVYFIATQKPDNKAVKDMLDRAFGKLSVDHVDLSVDARAAAKDRPDYQAAQTKAE